MLLSFQDFLLDDKTFANHDTVNKLNHNLLSLKVQERTDRYHECELKYLLGKMFSEHVGNINFIFMIIDLKYIFSQIAVINNIHQGISKS